MERRALISSLLCQLLLAHAAAAENATGSMDLLLRDANGNPVVAQKVLLKPIRPTPGQDTPIPEAMTDAHGIVHFPWQSGDLHIHVPGVGYALIGEVPRNHPGQNNIATQDNIATQVPRLVPYAHLVGHIPAGSPPDTLTLKTGGYYGYNDCRIWPDKNGTFDGEVPAGQWWVWAEQGKKRVLQVESHVAVATGQTAEVILKPIPAKPAVPPLQNVRQSFAPEDKTLIPWVQGRVFDEQNRPIAGAQIIAVAVYDGGLRMYENAHHATSGLDGRYTITGESGLSHFSASVVATAPDRTPTWAWLAGNEPQFSPPAIANAKSQPAPVTSTIDLVLPHAGGKLQVRVLAQGQPAAGVAVIIRRQGVALRDQWAAGGGDDDGVAAREITAPTAVTDAQGIVQFDHLIPGRHDIVAEDATPSDLRGRVKWAWDDSEIKKPLGQAIGVDVPVDSQTHFSLNLEPASVRASLRVAAADGTLLTENMSFAYGQVNTRGVRWTSQVIDRGQARLFFAARGLWNVSFRYRPEEKLTSIPISPPYLAAEGIVGFSPLLDSAPQATLTVKPIALGIVRTSIRDPSGKPISGVVTIGQNSDLVHYAAHTDARGDVTFTGVDSSDLQITGQTDGPGPPPLGDLESPMPEEKSLLGRSAIIPVSVNAIANTDQQITLREQPVGYIMGKIIPPAGQAASTYVVYLGDYEVQTGYHHRASTGEFVLGPFAPGTVRLRVVRYGADPNPLVANTTVEAGKVTHIDLHPVMPPTAADGDSSGMPNMAGEFNRRDELLAGRVLLSDGKTPALGAQVELFPDSGAQPQAQGVTDANGILHARGLWRALESGPTETGREPEGQHVIASLPGSCGAVIRPWPPQPNDSADFILPAPRKMTGRVTLAQHVQGHIIVLATPEGAGRFTQALSISTTADGEGRFELGGVTPGTYHIQAALDNIWLSNSITQHLTDKDISGVNLDIAAPGVPLQIRLVDAVGHAAINAPLTVDQPAGPLLSLWPKVWLSDGAGLVNIPTLNAGPHELHALDQTLNVIVPPLPANQPLAVTITTKKGTE